MKALRQIAFACALLCHVATSAQAQAQTPPAAASPATAQPAADASPDPIGNVASLTGTATVTRNNVTGALKLQDDIFKNDILQTSANSKLGVTFNDATTFNLTANARIAVDEFVYAEGGSGNAAVFDIAKGTVAFVAAAVAKTGDMKIATPTASLGIRGTSGLVEVPDGAVAGPARDVAIKLYPDADGRVGRIEVNGRDGARLGALTQGASGFAIRGGAGARFAAVPLALSPQQMQRDRGIVQQVHLAQNVGRGIVTQRRNEIRTNPAARNDPARRPATMRPAQPQQRPGLQPRTPGQPNLQRPNQQGPTPQRPDLQRLVPQRQGLQQPGTLQPAVQQARPSALPLPGRQARPALQRRPAFAAPRQKQPRKRL